ncbi:CLUMA_CG006798, isoform A [Clunio marinus]|uniref:CLUMA_CG006798, isoform A n=1 Tax=Clunio marinus TaxID=568069 RepID=A0A1J1HYT2_9DIPT|nr:CLUMA_CG006798, isoform A [Clunio marinus]
MKREKPKDFCWRNTENILLHSYEKLLFKTNFKLEKSLIAQGCGFSISFKENEKFLSLDICSKEK